MAVGKRALAVLASGALLGVLNPFASPAMANHTQQNTDDPPGLVNVSAFCADSPGEMFSDVSSNTTGFFEIGCAQFLDIVRGGPEGRPSDQYGPILDVSRAQMATFIVGMMDAAEALDSGDNIRELPQGDGVVPFTDVSRSNTHFDSIDRLEQQGLVRGGPEDRPTTQYGPELRVSRAQIATFIFNAIEFLDPDAVDETSRDFFIDDAGDTHEENINKDTNAGLIAGRSADQYDPEDNVSRAQMASFIIRPLALLFAQGQIDRARDDVQGPLIVEARVATDAATSTADSTGTASAGDVLELEFDDSLATTTADGITILVEDDDGDRAVIECGADEGVDETLSGGEEDVTAAECELNDDETELTVTLLEDAVDTNPDEGNDDDLQFPLEILDVGGATDEAGNEVDVADSDDTTIDRDEDTQDVAAPSGGILP
jgi:hypothetical protein